MHEVNLHRLAAKELRDASMWYRSRSERASTRFRAAVFDAIEWISPTLTFILYWPIRIVALGSGDFRIY
jgi:hypothetical protein